MTPLVIGRKLTISPFLVFISFIFWLWLWGPIGAVLSTPILLVGLLAREEIANYRKAQQDAEQAESEALPASDAASGTAPALAR